MVATAFPRVSGLLFLKPRGGWLGANYLSSHGLVYPDVTTAHVS